ncbi:hypothetical protein SHI21_15050 [Bacteriovorax sp. PP10]|uniref:Uncharacterized protein n=1 Tax=Bacteriovorax antarcticus TaxID=3088717 RepID=A0ABU5VWV3_9BACT|nr:hypothetical protein [Bacteriovorax sp. PP10]MEA9357544.1 hypothetical protein [Bacteriovorax sp. PP10]
MKANLLVLTLLTLATTVSAKEAMYVEGGLTAYKAYAAEDGNANPFKNGVPGGASVAMMESEKDMKIANLNKLLDQQQHSYDEKISYLQDELKKSKERLIEKSINTEKMQANVEKRFSEESSYLKKELVAKTKTLMEYQRQLEKIKPSEELKSLINSNAALAVELRKSNDQLAIIQLQTNEAMAAKPAPTQVTHGRMPASVEGK